MRSVDIPDHLAADVRLVLVDHRRVHGLFRERQEPEDRLRPPARRPRRRSRPGTIHRTPDLLRDLIRNTPAKVFIAVAGLSAALPGTIAAHTTKPVIGVPVSGKLNLDAILSVSQMPPGDPVAAVGLDRGENAAILAVEMLALHDERLAEKLKDHRDAMKKWGLEDSRTLGE